VTFLKKYTGVLPFAVFFYPHIILYRKPVNSIFAEESLNTAAILEKELQQTGSANKVREFRLQRMDGSKGHAEVVGTHFYTKGQSLSLLIVRDITERKKSEQLIEFMAYHDSLTKLLNRESFQMKVKEHLKREQNGVMLFIDLDRFKMINDTLGLRTGDLLLIEVSKRLKVYEEGILSRQGGDEFTIYFPNICKEQAKEKTEEILDCLSKPYIIEGQELYVTPSVGMSIFPTDSRDYDMLIQKADVALYESKAAGGNTYTFYSAESKEVNEKKMTISNDLRKALLKGEFYLCYQPIFDTATREIVGAEALLRWNHPVRGFIAPDEFIPIAEETGLIIPIGEWVIRTACQQMKQWYEEGFRFQISVNLSLRQFIQYNLVEMIEKILKQVDLSPQLLNLEVTESVPLLDVEASIKKLNDLKTLGITISLDDFGTGYSSLNHIRLLPFDYLKIDRSFVQNMETDNVNSSIVQSVISLAHIMGKRVVAEGVETEQQLSLLHGTMWDEAQGYYLSKPVEVELFNKLINKKNSDLV
jgi:diguanylate cyclase (GGDEF)-like protein